MNRRYIFIVLILLGIGLHGFAQSSPDLTPDQRKMIEQTVRQQHEPAMQKQSPRRIHPFYWFGGGLALIFFIAVVYKYRLYKRKVKLKQFAENAGLEFYDRESSLFNKFPFQLFQKGDKREVFNFIKAPDGDDTIIICDYVYTVVRERYDRSRPMGMRRRQSNTPFAQTICIIMDEEMWLPEMFMRKEHMFDWLVEKFGGQDIDFDFAPQFSSEFVLRGSVEDRIKASISSDARNLFLAGKKLFKTFEANDSGFMLNFGKRLPIDKYSEFIQFARNLHACFKKTAQKN